MDEEHQLIWSRLEQLEARITRIGEGSGMDEERKMIWGRISEKELERDQLSKEVDGQTLERMDPVKFNRRERLNGDLDRLYDLLESLNRGQQGGQP